MSEDDVRRRRASRVPNMCPECVRPFAARTTANCRFAVLLGKPSDGIEPSTPSLRCAPFGKRSQPTATVLACLRRFRAEAICDRLPRVATTGLHKGPSLVVREGDSSPAWEAEVTPTPSDRTFAQASGRCLRASPRPPNIRARAACAMLPVPCEVSTSNQASLTSSVAVTVAAISPSGDPRRVRTAVLVSAIASAMSRPPQATCQWLAL
jgi:hypothetical protein